MKLDRLFLNSAVAAPTLPTRCFNGNLSQVSYVCCACNMRRVGAYKLAGGHVG